MILQGRFCGKVRSGHKGSRAVSRMRLISARRCTTECFAIAKERALLRFVNCWSMTGAFRRRSLRSGTGPGRNCGPDFRGISGTPCITRSAAERDGRQCPVLRHPSDRRGTGHWSAALWLRGLLRRPTSGSSIRRRSPRRRGRASPIRSVLFALDDLVQSAGGRSRFAAAMDR